MEGRGWRAWLALVAAVAIVAAVSATAYRLAGYSLSQAVEYRSPYASLPRSEPATAGPPMTSRVVLVIVDGLRLDVSRRMRGLSILRQHGTGLVLEAPQPSVSLPNWTTILAGAPPAVTGVTSGLSEERVRVDTLLDEAFAEKRSVVVVGPKILQRLYDVRRARGVSLRDRGRGQYVSRALVDDAITLTRRARPSLVVIHLPELDEAGHAEGGASQGYFAQATAIDADLQRLVERLQDGETTFVIVTDHGHTDRGGHGGPEPSVVKTPGVFAGKGVRIGGGVGRLEDVAPTVSALLGIPTPRQATGRVLTSVLATSPPEVLGPARTRRGAFAASYIATLTGQPSVDLEGRSDQALTSDMARAVGAREARERATRLPMAALVATGALFALVAVWLASGRALLAALAGTAAYYLVYGGLFFGVHRLTWSLSVLEYEERIRPFIGGRTAEAALAGVAGCVTAALVYAASRKRPKGPRQGYSAGWLLLAPVTVLVIQATLALQVAWFLWEWGPSATWRLPDLVAGFKYYLDLLQAAAVGGSALLGAVATYLVGRYHPRVRPAAD